MKSLDFWSYQTKQKVRILARLVGIQKALCQGPNDFLNNLETVRIEEFNGILD